MKIPSVVIRHNPEPGRALPWGAFWRNPPGITPKRPAKYFPTERDAITFRDDFIAGLKAAARSATAPEPTDPTNPKPGTVAAYLATWLRVHIKPKKDGSTYASYEQLVRLHIIPARLFQADGITPPPATEPQTFGDLPIATVKRLKVREMLDGLKTHGGKSLATRKHAHSALSSAFGYAVLDEVIDYNPCLKLGSQIRHQDEDPLEPEPNPFTKEQAAAFLAWIFVHEREWFEYFQFLHDTGVRVGELAALKWTHVDLKHKRAKIVASYSPKEKRDKAPKTHQVRWIDLTDVVVAQLTALRKRQRVETLKAGRTEREYVFTNRNGSPRRQDGNMRRVFHRVIAQCRTGKGWKAPKTFEVDDHTPHDVRDTFATTHLCADFGRLPWVSKQLGHETERTTVEHYFKFLPTTVTQRYANMIR